MPKYLETKWLNKEVILKTVSFREFNLDYLKASWRYAELADDWFSHYHGEHVLFTKQRILQEINQNQFESMIIQKEVEGVAIVNDRLVEVSLKSAYVSKYFKDSPQGMISVKKALILNFRSFQKRVLNNFLKTDKEFPSQ